MLLIAMASLQEAVRRRIVLAGALLTVAFLALFGVGVWFAFDGLKAEGSLDPVQRQLFGGFLLSGGMWVLNFAASLLAIFTAVRSISGEVEEGTLAAVATRPLARWRILIGKALGLGAMLVLFVAVSTSAAFGIVYFIGGYMPGNPFLPPLLILLSAWVVQCLTLLGTTRLPTVANGILIFALFALGLVGGLVEQIGLVLDNDSMLNVGIASSLIVPSRAVFDMASLRVLSGVSLPSMGGGAGGPFGFANPPSVWMAVYAVGYAVAALALAVRSFSRRDL